MSDSTVQIIERFVIAGIAITARALAGIDGIDLTFPQWRVLVVLGEVAEGATVSEVASLIGVTVPATSRQLRRLERRDLLTIEPDSSDRRATRARLTLHGRRVRRRIFEFRRAEIVRAVSDTALDARALAKLSDVAASMSGEY